MELLLIYNEILLQFKASKHGNITNINKINL